METSKNKKIRLRNLVEDWNFSAYILFVSTKLVLFFYKILPDKGKDGWRKTTEVHHRNDEAKYIGSLHNLALNLESSFSKSDTHKTIINKLYNVFIKVPDLHYALRWKRNACIRIPYGFTDIMEVSFHSTGTIYELFFYPDKVQPGPSIINDNVTKELLEDLKKAYNETYLLQDKKRSLQLYSNLYKSTSQKARTIPETEIKTYLERMLSATWINFKEEEANAESRMAPYFFTNQKHAGFGVLNIHCKHSIDFKWLDIWMQFSHIGIDGRAAAKLQSKVYNAFGTYDPELTFPRDFKFNDKFFVYKYPDRNVFHGCSFVDLGPLFSLRKELHEITGNILPVTILIWGLAKHPLFKGVKFNIPVDIPADDSKERTVGFVFVKPEKYLKTFTGEKAFVEYITSFNKQVKGIRKRQNENYYFMQSSIMASHGMLSLMLKYLSSGLYAFTGKTCITLMENIEYAIPSLSDNINSIIAISIIQKDNNTTACVALRAKTDMASQLLSAVNDVVENINEIIQIDIQ